jgi:hypothetical protein
MPDLCVKLLRIQDDTLTAPPRHRVCRPLPNCGFRSVIWLERSSNSYADSASFAFTNTAAIAIFALTPVTRPHLPRHPVILTEGIMPVSELSHSTLNDSSVFHRRSVGAGI